MVPASQIWGFKFWGLEQNKTSEVVSFVGQFIDKMKINSINWENNW